MNEKKRTIAIIVTIVAVLMGAGALYAFLAPSMAPDQLSVVSAQRDDAGRDASEATDGGSSTAPGDSADNSDTTGDPDSMGSADAGAASESEAADEQSQLLAAPDFTAYDAQGNEVRLADYAGRPVVLNFWASWCSSCKLEMPHFDEKHRELGDDVQFLMVNVTDGTRETVESALAYIEGQGYSFPVLFDTEMSATMTYQAYTLPTTYFIDAQGHLIARATGAIDADMLQRGIDMITPAQS